MDGRRSSKPESASSNLAGSAILVLEVQMDERPSPKGQVAGSNPVGDATES